jgi:hypothetical protein
MHGAAPAPPAVCQSAVLPSRPMNFPAAAESLAVERTSLFVGFPLATVSCARLQGSISMTLTVTTSGLSELDVYTGETVNGALF